MHGRASFFTICNLRSGSGDSAGCRGLPALETGEHDAGVHNATFDKQKISAQTSMRGRGCAIMRTRLGKGFWFMRGVPGKQDPM